MDLLNDEFCDRGSALICSDDKYATTLEPMWTQNQFCSSHSPTYCSSFSKTLNQTIAAELAAGQFCNYKFDKGDINETFMLRLSYSKDV